MLRIHGGRSQITLKSLLKGSFFSYWGPKKDGICNAEIHFSVILWDWDSNSEISYWKQKWVWEYEPQEGFVFEGVSVSSCQESESLWFMRFSLTGRDHFTSCVTYNQNYKQYDGLCTYCFTSSASLISGLDDCVNDITAMFLSRLSPSCCVWCVFSCPVTSVYI